VSLNPTDSEAIGASLSEPRSFGVIFERHFPAIHAYLRRRLDDQRADEVTAQTFFVAFDQRGRFDLRRPNARPWLFGIATNVAHGHRRHELRELRAVATISPEPAGPLDGVEARLDAERMRGVLARGLADLPAEEADVLLLLVWAELSQAEIADALEIPLGTVKSRLSRARARLRDALGLVDAAPANGSGPAPAGRTLHDPDPTQTGGERWTS
jgi:RNA polymerase sigma-70 factor (ECF subfamily)